MALSVSLLGRLMDALFGELEKTKEVSFDFGRLAAFGKLMNLMAHDSILA